MNSQQIADDADMIVAGYAFKVKDGYTEVVDLSDTSKVSVIQSDLISESVMSDEEDANVFCEKAKKYDLIMVPSDSFGVKGYVRLAYCIETEKVERSIPVLRRFVEENYR